MSDSTDIIDFLRIRSIFYDAKGVRTEDKADLTAVLPYKAGVVRKQRKTCDLYGHSSRSSIFEESHLP